MSDLETGRDAMRMFFDANKRYAGAPQSFDSYYALYGKKADIYADGIGMAIRENDLSEREVSSAMQSLASRTQGKIPGDHNAYFAAIGGVAGQINYLDLAGQVTADVAGDVLDGAVALGDNLLTVVKIANFVLPFVACYFGYLYLRKQSGRLK